MGRLSLTGGVRPAGPERIQFDFTIEHVRYRPTLPWQPQETNLRRARALLAEIKVRIAAGTFDFLSEFPIYRYRRTGRVLLRTRTCNDMFDLFLRHEETRVKLGDLAPTTLAAHRQLLDHTWRPAVGALPLLGVRYSQLIAVPTNHTWSKKTYNNAVSALRLALGACLRFSRSPRPAQFGRLAQGPTHAEKGSAPYRSRRD